jgi:hypothetical protein
MATTTYGYINKDDATSSPYLAIGCRVVCTRESADDAGVTCSLQFFAGFGSNSNSTSHTGYEVQVELVQGSNSSGKITINKQNNTWSRTGSSKKALSSISGITMTAYETHKSKTSGIDFEMDWTSGTKTFTVKLYHNGSLWKSYQTASTVSCPTYTAPSTDTDPNLYVKRDDNKWYPSTKIYVKRSDNKWYPARQVYVKRSDGKWYPATTS